MKQSLLCTAAATVISSAHRAHAAINFTRVLTETEPVLPDLFSGDCDTSLCKCMQEAYGDPELCVPEIDSTCKTDGFRRIN